MKSGKVKWFSVTTALILLFTLVWNMSGTFQDIIRITSIFSATAVLPNGSSSWYKEKEHSSVSAPNQSSSSQNSDSSHNSSSFDTSTLPPERPTDVETGDIKTTMLSVTSANTTYDNLHVSNKTGKTIDIENLLGQGLPFRIEETDQPQVLIYHTHATESYTAGDYGYYIKSDSTRSKDTSKNTVRVGQAIADILNSNGIVTINDDTLHDADAYTGSYDRSAATVQEYLKKYPSIKVIIDGHRDAITQSNDVKVKPTAEVNGKKAAQVMVLAGCETGDITDFPNWEQNLRFNLLLQRQLESDYPGLARAMSFKACKYNFDIMNGSILLEIGSEANTLEEAVYSGELIGNALVKVLKGT